MSVVSAVLLLNACTHSPEQADEGAENRVEVDFSKANGVLTASTFVEQSRNIRLQLPEDEFIGQPVQLIFSGEDWFVHDKLQKCIYRFSKEGVFRNKIARFGQGPEEYTTISSVMARANPQELYVYDKIARKMLVYGFEGNFLRSVAVENMANALTLLPDGKFLCFTPDFIYNGPSGLWVMSEDGKFEKMELEYTEKYPVLYSFWNYFYPISSREIGIACPATNRYLRYDCATGKVSIELQMDVRQKTANSFPGIDNSMKVKEPFWSCPIFACSPRLIFGIWTEYQGQSQGVFSLYEKEKQRMTCYPQIDASPLGLEYIGEPVPSNLPNSLVTYFPAETEENTISLYIYSLK